MKQLPALLRNDDGSLHITDGKNILGSLIPVAGKEGYYTIRTGTFGGFFNREMEFNDALQFLKQRLIITHTVRLNSIFRGANLIHKRKSKS